MEKFILNAVVLSLGILSLIIVGMFIYLEFSWPKQSKKRRKKVERDVNNFCLKHENLTKEVKHFVVTKNNELFEITNSFVDNQSNEENYFGIKYVFSKKKNCYIAPKKNIEQVVNKCDIIKHFQNELEAQKYMWLHNHNF